MNDMLNGIPEFVDLLKKGEIVASGTHEQLMMTSPEYVQIYQSQQSTHELQPQ